MHETASFVVKPETSPERQEFYDRLDSVHTAPLWEVLNRLVLPEPNPAMHTGDFVLTPSWTFHDHGNLGSAPVIWMDVLDLPIVNLFDTSFAEHHPDETQPVSRNDGDALARFGGNMSRRTSSGSSARSDSLSAGRMNVLIPKRLAASAFSRMPPTGNTSPLSVISPVIATSCRTAWFRAADRIAVAIVTPAEGPSFGIAPAGT